MAVNSVENPTEPTRLALKSGGCLEIIKKDHPNWAEDPKAGKPVRVVDDRYEGNPSFQIRNSCFVRTRAKKREILAALIAYNKAHPTDPPWERTLASLEKEWDLHNLAYRLHICRKSARHVDLDNRDEGGGYLHFFVTGVARVFEKLAAIKKRP